MSKALPVIVLSLVLGLLPLVGGCAGNELKLAFLGPQEDAQQEPAKEIVFPNGTMVGGAASDQAQALAQILVDAHNASMQEFGKLKKQSKEQAEEQRKAIEANRQTAEKALAILTLLSKSQGSGEITLFFRVRSSVIRKNSLDYQRLVRFVDYVSREARGRKVMFALVGSASSTGGEQMNLRLSQARANAPIKIIDQYLVNLPHEYFKVGGVGEMYSPKGVTLDVHKRYQNVRVIAFYETDQLPELPKEVAEQ